MERAQGLHSPPTHLLLDLVLCWPWSRSQRPLWAQSLELPQPVMQPLPAGALLEEAVEESPGQPEREPKVVDPGGDLLHSQDLSLPSGIW